MLMEPLQTRDGRPVRVGRGIYPGDPDTYLSYDKAWAIKVGAVPKPPQRLRINNKTKNELLIRIAR